MHWKTTAVLVLATIGVGAYISLYEIKQPPPEMRQELAKRLLDVSPESVTHLAISLPNANVALARTGTTWGVTPPGARADVEVVTQALETIHPLESQRTLIGTSQKPLDLKVYGLDPAVGQVTVTANAAPITVFFGNATAIQRNRYVKISGRPEVFVVPEAAYEAVNQTTNSFRDTHLMRLETWLVDNLEMTSPRATIALVQRGDTWQLTQPIADRADRANVTALLEKLSDIRIQRFVDDHPKAEEVPRYGFDHPEAEVRLTMRESATTRQLFFGSPVEDDASLRYVKRDDEPFLYAVSAADMESLLPDPSTLRQRACFEFFPAAVTRIELIRANGRVMLERVDQQWRETTTGTPADTTRVERLLKRLAELRASSFLPWLSKDELAAHGLEPAQIAIAVWTSDSPDVQRLRIGGPVSGSQDRYGMLEGRRVIVELAADAAQAAETSLESLRASPATSAAPSTSP